MRTNRYDEEMIGRQVWARIYKRQLADRHAIHCSYCRYHKGENITHLSPNADPRKRHVRWKRLPRLAEW